MCSGIATEGTCAIAMEEQTARHLAGTFLGGGDGTGDLPRLSAWEVMCELSNMLCGTFLGQFDCKESYALSSPRSMLPGEVGLMKPLHRSVLQTKHGGLLFVMALDADKTNERSAR